MNISHALKLSFNVTFCLFLFPCASFGLQKKSLLEVTTDSIMVDTQLSPSGAGDDHVASLWWLPLEFWESTYARDTTTSSKDKASLLAALKGVSLLGVVQADISSLGAFKFYSKDEVQENLKVFITKDGKTQLVGVISDVNPDLEVVLAILKPLLAQAMGNMGQNLHFFVLEDLDKNGDRILDPYSKGEMEIILKDKGGNKLKGDLYLPLNSLFVPRVCPNGREAHATWVFCPWSGEKL